MPFLRFSRDKRGYANTYLCHTFREEGVLRMRVLYWFRTPPDVEVGRPALDAEAIRDIEASNPGLTFDWDEILKAKPPAAARDRDGREGRERGSRRRGRGTSARSGAAAAAAGTQERSSPAAGPGASVAAETGTPPAAGGPPAGGGAADAPAARPGRRRRRRRRRAGGGGGQPPAPPDGPAGAAPAEPDPDPQ